MYVRTKDGIYEIDKNTKGTEDFLWVKTNKANIVQCVWLNCIINEADTIEELCDFILVWYEKMNEPVFVKYNSITYTALKENNRFKENKCYGAIWTNKGLIYVAKMDSEGKLELI